MCGTEGHADEEAVFLKEGVVVALAGGVVQCLDEFSFYRAGFRLRKERDKFGDELIRSGCVMGVDVFIGSGR
jgi:hypothetical protein